MRIRSALFSGWCRRASSMRSSSPTCRGIKMDGPLRQVQSRARRGAAAQRPRRRCAGLAQGDLHARALARLGAAVLRARTAGIDPRRSVDRLPGPFGGRPDTDYAGSARHDLLRAIPALQACKLHLGSRARWAREADSAAHRALRAGGGAARWWRAGCIRQRISRACSASPRAISSTATSG